MPRLKRKFDLTAYLSFLEYLALRPRMRPAFDLIVTNTTSTKRDQEHKDYKFNYCPTEHLKVLEALNQSIDVFELHKTLRSTADIKAQK